DDTGFMYQFSLGVNYILTENIDIGARYRYAATEGLELTGAGSGATARDFDVETHNFTANLTYNF
ncbi:MAG: outer membrane beta-barrel protein, partial [Pseudomonadota bacterium]